MILFCRSIDVIPNVVSESDHEHVCMVDGVVVKEDVIDVASMEVVNPLFERARLLDDGVGSDSVDC